jgi:hypothetical protein
VRPTLEQAIHDRVAESAELWFPGVGANPTVRLRPLVERPRATLYAVHVGEVPGPPLVLAKVRRGWPGGESGQWAGTRPRLVSHPLPAPEQVALEYSGLRAIHAMIAPGDSRFRAVRPLDHIVAEDTLLMEYVAAPTLRRLFAQESRLSPRGLMSSRRTSDEVWRRVGSWLRVFQESMPATGLPARQATRDEVAERFRAYEEFFRGRPGGRSAADAARLGADLAAAELPERLSMAVGHGDFAPRNVFVHQDDRISVFDPLPRWIVPRSEDLCRFLVAVRFSGALVHTRGAAYGAADLDRLERAVLAGFGAGQDLPPGELRCLQLLVTLDTWSALLDAPAGGWRGRLRRAAAERASGFVHRETTRLLESARSVRQ